MTKTTFTRDANRHHEDERGFDRTARQRDTTIPTVHVPSMASCWCDDYHTCQPPKFDA